MADTKDIPDAQQISLEELDAIDAQLGASIIKLAATNTDYRGHTGRQSDEGQQLQYESTMRVVIAYDPSSGLRYALNYTAFAMEHLVEFHEGVSIENGVMGGRWQGASSLLAKLGKWGAYLEPLLLGGGSAPALLKAAATAFLQGRVAKSGGLLEQLLARPK